MFPARLDDKGRMKLPTAFQTYFNSLPEKKLFVTSLDRRIAQIYPIAAWRENEKFFENYRDDPKPPRASGLTPTIWAWKPKPITRGVLHSTRNCVGIWIWRTPRFICTRIAGGWKSWTRRARRWARKHRTAVSTATTTALVAALLTGAYVWSIVDRTQKADTTGLATLARAESLEADARQTNDPDPDRWAEAIAEARRAEGQLESGGGSATVVSRAKARIAEWQDALGVVQRDRKMLTELDEARLLAANVRGGHFDFEEKAEAILAAFQSYGIDLAKLTVEEAASRVRSSRIATDLVTALDEAIPFLKDSRRERLQGVVQSADPDGAEIRRLIAAGNFEGLRRLVADEASRRKWGPRCRTIFSTLATLDPAASLPLLEAIHSQNRTDFWWNHDLARACQQAKPPRFEQAIRYYYAARALKPTSPGVFLNLGAALSQKGELDSAIAAYDEAIRLNPDYAAPHSNLGGILYMSGRLDQAIAECREAIRLKPDYAEAHDHLGHALAKKGELDAAIAEYREEIRLKPDDAQAHDNLGLTLYKKGSLDAAIVAFREAIRLKPDLAAAHTNLGLALIEKGEIDAAIAAYREAIRLKPALSQPHYNLGNALSEKGELDAAIAAYREAIRLRPDDAQAQFNLGNALSEKGEIDAAIAAYREAIRLKPDLVEAYSNLGFALSEKGEIDAAIAAYREAIRLQPAYFEAHSNLGLAFAKKGELDAAIAAYREAIRVKPDWAGAYSNLGLALYKKGEIEPAIAAFREAIRLKPDLAEAHCNLAGFLEARGRFAEALVHWERGHELGSRTKGWSYPTAQLVQRCRRLAALEARLPTVLKGEGPSLEPAERLELADVCSKKALYLTSARFYDQAFADQPRLAEDLGTGNRYKAACAGALAGSGAGKDDPPPDDSARAKLREQARSWLRADLDARGKVLESGNARDRPVIVQSLDQWKKNSDLAGIRDEGALAKLPEGEREGFRALWAEVDRVLAKARAGAP